MFRTTAQVSGTHGRGIGHPGRFAESIHLQRTNKSDRQIDKHIRERLRNKPCQKQKEHF